MTDDPALGQTHRIALHVEELAVERREVETGRVKVEVKTSLREHEVNETRASYRVEIERVTIGRVVATMPSVREEGDVTIIPVVEEVVVVERRLVLKEEVRLRRVQTIDRHRETVGLRVQEAVISRTDTDGDQSPPTVVPDA